MKNCRYIKTRRGTIQSPVFIPIATKGAVKSLTPEELKELGAQMVLGNTYHLWLRPGTEIIKKSGDLHKFMNWPGPILTDSGGYQVFSLRAKTCSANGFQKRKIFPSPLRHSFSEANEKNFIRQNCSFSAQGKTMPTRNFERFGMPSTSPKDNFVKISDQGVEFRDPIDGKKYFLTPEKSIQIQLDLGSDIIMVLDECPPYQASRAQVERAVSRTTKWAKRCKDYFEKKTKKMSLQGASPFTGRRGNPAIQQPSISSNIIRDRSPRFRESEAGHANPNGLTRDDNWRPLLFGIIQGGIYKSLRERSAREILDIGFDGYAIGGVAVGEPRKYLWDVLKYVLPLLPEDKPRYLMGLGRPEEIAGAVNAGIDMFDCVIPTREARHGRLYKWKNSSLRGLHICGGQSNPAISQSSSGSPRSLHSLAITKGQFYQTIQITNAKFSKDFNPIDKNCSCYACQNYSRAYLHHLFKIAEPLALRLATIHNLKFYFEFIKKLKQ